MTIYLDRIETLRYLTDLYINDKRLVVSRYNDGEYLLMNNMVGHVAQKQSTHISDMLIKAIKTKDQFICINYLKPHNELNKDIWYRTKEYLVSVSNYDLYGCGNWLIQDFCEDLKLLPLLFNSNTLIVTSNSDRCSKIFNNDFPFLNFYNVPATNAMDSYEDILYDLNYFSSSYKNILFACGPLSKVLIASMVSTCSCNLVDIGSILNALIDTTNEWPMSWVASIDLNSKRSLFMDKLRSLNYKPSDTTSRWY